MSPGSSHAAGATWLGVVLAFSPALVYNTMQEKGACRMIRIRITSGVAGASFLLAIAGLLFLRAIWRIQRRE